MTGRRTLVRVALPVAVLFLVPVLTDGCGSISTVTPDGGAAGTTGRAGTTGSAGTSGGAGATGSAGTTGTAGTVGAAGTTGSAGRGGTSGSAGHGGTTGGAGRGGTTGSAGTTGGAGTSGSAGRGGTTGGAGTTGTGGRGGTSGSAGINGGGGRGGGAGTGTADAGPCNCPLIYMPVCGADGKTYSSDCEAKCAGVDVAYTGACGACSSNGDCVHYADGVGDCCGACLPKAAPQPPTISCLLACQMPVDCVCTAGMCTAVPKAGTAALTSEP